MRNIKDITIAGILMSLTALGMTAIICGSDKENEKERMELANKRRQLDDEEKMIEEKRISLGEALEKKKKVESKMNERQSDLEKRENELKIEMLEFNKIKTGLDDVLREIKDCKK